jgi:hypothetical protein
MYAIEFTTQIENGIVKIPKNYQNLSNQNVQVFILPIKKPKDTFNPRDFFGVTSFSKSEIDSYLQDNRDEWDNYLNEKIFDRYKYCHILFQWHHS